MKTYNNHSLALLTILLVTFAASHAADNWITLFDGTNTDHWNTTGDANWNIAGEVIQADAGSGMLVTRLSYIDFELSLEFWADKNSNSGVFIRCSDPEAISPDTCYEVNIFDTRPDQSGRSGAIVNVAPPAVVIDTEGQWNTYEILADGTHLLVRLNGKVTVDARDDNLKQGHVALQFAAGGIKFRNVRIRSLQQVVSEE